MNKAVGTVLLPPVTYVWISMFESCLQRLDLLRHLKHSRAFLLSQSCEGRGRGDGWEEGRTKVRQQHIHHVSCHHSTLYYSTSPMYHTSHPTATLPTNPHSITSPTHPTPSHNSTHPTHLIAHFPRTFFCLHGCQESLLHDPLPLSLPSSPM